MLKLTVIVSLIASSILAMAHILAIELYLYWRYPWFDISTHFLGGAVIVLFLFATTDLSMPIPKGWLRFVPALVIVFIIALVWEMYEVLIGIPIEENHIGDTILDLCMGLIGGMVGYVVARALVKLQ